MNERGTEAVNDLVESNMGLVYHAARRFSGRGMETEDLIQTGAIGLIKAARAFDETRGTAFSTYAFAMITGEMRRALRDFAPIRVSRRYRELKTRIDSLVAEANSEGRELRIHELAALLHEDEREIAAAISLSQPIISLDETIQSAEGELSLSDVISGPKNAEEEAIPKILTEELISSLPEKERELIRLRYYDEASQLITARALGVSQPCVSRAEKRILKALRESAG